MTIAASSGLSDKEIENMISEAEKHAEEDATKKSVIEAKNNADSIIASTEKSMEEFKDQLEKEEADKIKSIITELRSMIANEQASLDEIKEKSGELQQGSLKLFEMVYKKKQGEDAAASSSSEKETVDAEYKDVNKEGKN